MEVKMSPKVIQLRTKKELPDNVRDELEKIQPLYDALDYAKADILNGNKAPRILQLRYHGKELGVSHTNHNWSSPEELAGTLMWAVNVTLTSDFNDANFTGEQYDGQDNTTTQTNEGPEG